MIQCSYCWCTAHTLDELKKKIIHEIEYTLQIKEKLKIKKIVYDERRLEVIIQSESKRFENLNFVCPFI